MSTEIIGYYNCVKIVSDKVYTILYSAKHWQWKTFADSTEGQLHWQKIFVIASIT